MRRLGLWSASALAVANMVGAGVFTTSGFALDDLGRREWVLLAWLVGGLLALCGALSYGALARRFPESGGEYFFLGRLVHPFVGFLAGWVSLLAGFTAPIAAAALAFEAYLAPDGGVLAPKWFATGVIAASAAIHGIRLKAGVIVQNVSVAVKLVLIGVIVAYGAARFATGNAAPAAEPVPFDLGAFAVTLVWISFAYSGWNAAVYVGGEVRDPGRNLNRSIWVPAVAVALVYVGLNTVFLYSAPVSELAGVPEVGAVAAEALGGKPMRVAVSYVIALALFTSISAMVMAGPRVYARMADDGLFPRVFAKFDDVPNAAIALQCALAIVVVWLSGLAQLLGYIGFTLGLCSAATVVSLVVLRLREGPERVPIPGFPWIPAVFVAMTLGSAVFMIERRPHEAALGVLTVATGIPAYLIMRRRGRSLDGSSATTSPSGR